VRVCTKPKKCWACGHQTEGKARKRKPQEKAPKGRADWGRRVPSLPSTKVHQFTKLYQVPEGRSQYRSVGAINMKAEHTALSVIAASKRSEIPEGRMYRSGVKTSKCSSHKWRPRGSKGEGSTEVEGCQASPLRKSTDPQNAATYQRVGESTEV